MKHVFVAVLLAGTFAACTKTAEQKNCYNAATRAEYDHLIQQRAKDPKAPIVVAGQEYDCLGNSPTDTGKCYQAKSVEEFNKLSAEQMAHPSMAVVVAGQTYDCLKAAP